jgi:hypothetical protein
MHTGNELKAPALEKHSTYFEFLDACRLEGCPVCTLSDKAVHRHLDSLLYENVNDPGVRQKLRASLGFCRRHSQKLLTMGDAFGIAIIYQDVLKHIVGALQEDDAPESTGECPACAIERKASNSYVATLISFLADEELKKTLLKSDGLCLAHLKHCADTIGNAGLSPWLVALQIKNLRRRRHDLSEYVRKQDVQFKHETITKAEEQACENAIDFLVGMTV